MPARDPFTEPQIIAMLESRAFGIGDRQRNQALFCLECATGARINEILKLKRRDVMDDLGRIRKRISFTATKSGKTIDADLINPLALDFLWMWLRRMESDGFRTPDDFLFPSPQLRKQSICRQQIYKIYRRAAQEIGFDGYAGTHSCRKTWAIDTWKYYHKRQLDGEQIDPLMKLFDTGRWQTLDSCRRYLNSMQGDTKESQGALYPLAQKHFAGIRLQNTQTEQIAI